jgi:hypothetical protein
MKKTLISAALATFLMSMTAGTALMTAPAFAADDNAAPKVSRDVAKPLAEAQKDLQKSDAQSAMAAIKEAQGVSDKTPEDDYVINEFLANAAIMTKDYKTAQQAYEAMANSPVAPAAEKPKTLHNLVILSYQNKDYAKTAQYGKQLAALGPLDANTAAALAQAYYFTDDYADAEALTQKVVDADKAAGQAPDKNSLQILMSSQAKRNDQAGAAQTLRLLARYYGGPKEWGQLADVTLGTAGIQNAQGLDVFRLKMAAGAMGSSDDYNSMASLATQLGYPGEAVAALEKAQSAGVLSKEGQTTLAHDRSLAREDQRTLPSFAAQAAKRSTGEYSAKLAETYYGYGRYAESETAAKSALSKGKLKDTAQTNLVLGMAQVAQGKYADAKQAFDQAKSSGTAVESKVADLWSLYAESKANPAAPQAAQAQQQQQPQQPQQ